MLEQYLRTTREALGRKAGESSEWIGRLTKLREVFHRGIMWMPLCGRSQRAPWFQLTKSWRYLMINWLLAFVAFCKSFTKSWQRHFQSLLCTVLERSLLVSPWRIFVTLKVARAPWLIVVVVVGMIVAYFRLSLPIGSYLKFFLEFIFPFLVISLPGFSNFSVL